MIASNLSKVKTKDEFINKAHEARQARDLKRRQDNAATTIQAFWKAHLLRKKLIQEACKELNHIIDTKELYKSDDWTSLIKRLLFHCDPSKDRLILDKLLELILRLSRFSPCPTPDEGVPMSEDDVKIDLIEKHASNMRNIENQINSKHKNHKNFIFMIAEASSQSEKSLNSWSNILKSIMNLCFNYLAGIDANKADSLTVDLQYVNTYLKLINLFTTAIVSDSSYGSWLDDNQLSTLEGVISELNKWSHSKCKIVFNEITTFIHKIINRPLNEQKIQLLEQYQQLALRLVESSKSCLLLADEDHFITFGQHKDSIEILTTLLSVPALTYNLEQHATVCLDKLNENSVPKLCLKLLTTDDRNLQNLTSTTALCLLANIVHLAALNETLIKSDMMSFVILTTKLLESCQKDMKQEGKVGDRSKMKQNDSTHESYNHILGWLARFSTIDKDTSKLIKLQLSHLWSMKFLKLLLTDLIKYNEKRKVSIKQDGGGAKVQSSSNSPVKLRGSIFSSSRNVEPVVQSENILNPSTFMPISALKRAVERATLSMTRTINASYVKTTGSLSGSSGNAKLMTQEATRISLVCYMLYTALKTLRMIRQDILAAFCLHDFVLKNLWLFISSLGPQNGLKAFLEHLAIHTKTNAPEFQILILFCECASHLISILDDSELYEQQKPFSLEDLISISGFLNSFVFRIISNRLVSSNIQDMDPILASTHKLLADLYKRDCRRKFAPTDHWLMKDIKMSMLLKDLEAGRPIAKTILSLLPHIFPHKERVMLFRKMVANDKSQYCSGFSTFITIHRSRIVEDGYQQLARLPPNALKGLIRVKFINDHGLDEAGIDQDGVFKEFLEDTIKRVFDPALNLFCSTSEQRLYPSPTSRLHEDHLSLFNFVGKMLGKAVYEGIVVDVPFASFFLSRVLGQQQSPLYSPIDELPSLDPELYKSLTYIKHYEGDVSDLDLTFSIDQDFMGKIETHELEAGGKFIPVTRETRVRYIHSVANFRMKTQIEQQTVAFVRGFMSIIDLEWLSMFSTAEFQRLISGDESPIDLQDLRKHTKYFGGFHNNHRVVCWLWDILEHDFTSEELRLFLKFVTSCSKPPLLGFANLEPPFTIRCVEVSDDQDLGDTVGSVLRGFLAIRRSDPVDRLPTSSTCFNLLKLPNYQRRSTLRDKLRYAIRSSPGFELS